MLYLLPIRGKVGIVGAGISGLSFAYFLNKLRPDLSITIYERQDSVGGWINSVKLKDGDGSVILEKGPRTLRGLSEGTLLIVDILKQLNLSSQIQVMSKTSVANKKYLLSGDGSLVQVPDDGKITSFSKFVLSDLSSGLIAGVMGEPFRRKPKAKGDESIELFMERRFGLKKITNNIFSAIMHGIYAGDVSKLSARSIIPRLTDIENSHGSLIRGMFKKKKDVKQELSDSLSEYEKLISPNAQLSQLSNTLKKYPVIKLQDGLQTLPSAIADHLARQSNVKFEFGSQIEQINLRDTSITTKDGNTLQYDHIRSTINSHQLSNMLTGTTSELPVALKRLEYVSVFLVNIYSKTINLIPKAGHGFGFLVPKKIANPHSLLGVIYDSDIENNVQAFDNTVDTEKSLNPTSNGYSKVTLMMGGHFYKSSIPSDKSNLRAVKDILQNRLSVDLEGAKLVFQDPKDANKDITIGDNEILVSYVLHENCIPQYNVGYSELAEQVHKLLANGKLSLGGMAFGKAVGVPDCIQHSLEDAIKCK